VVTTPWSLAANIFCTLGDGCVVPLVDGSDDEVVLSDDLDDLVSLVHREVWNDQEFEDDLFVVGAETAEGFSPRDAVVTCKLAIGLERS
jgi:hypothetical protein